MVKVAGKRKVLYEGRNGWEMAFVAEMKKEGEKWREKKVCNQYSTSIFQALCHSVVLYIY